jgi:hypothetical protein
MMRGQIGAARHSFKSSRRAGRVQRILCSRADGAPEQSRYNNKVHVPIGSWIDIHTSQVVHFEYTHASSLTFVTLIHPNLHHMGR